MISELGVTDEEFGRAVGAFFFAYALMQVPAGWLADRLGARLMLTIYVVAWSLTTIMLGFVNSLAAIVTRTTSGSWAMVASQDSYIAI